MSNELGQSGPSYTPYDGGESTSIAPTPPHLDTSSTTATVPWRSKANLRIIRRLHMYAKLKHGMINAIGQSGPSYTSYDGVELTSIAPPSTHEGTTSTIATQPWRSKAKLRIIRRLHMYAKLKHSMSNAIGLPGHSYTPYGSGESTSIAPTPHHQDTPSTISMQPWRSKA